jgi:hypothetical protein
MIRRASGGNNSTGCYGLADNKVALDFVEGENNTIRTIQKRAYAFQDEDYLRVEILNRTCR